MSGIAYYRLENVFDPEWANKLLNYAVESKDNFVGTTTSTNESNYRSSRVLYNFDAMKNEFFEHLKKLLPDAIHYFGAKEMRCSAFEAQLTSSNDGDFYRYHNDNGSPDTADRKLTYVYYFCQDPKPYQNGALRLYKMNVENNFYVADQNNYIDLLPEHNSIVFFPSYYGHEVLPVSVPSKEFKDSRFTINGWLRGDMIPA